MTYEEQISRLQAALLQLELALDLTEPIFQEYSGDFEGNLPGYANAPTLETSLEAIDGAVTDFKEIIKELKRERRFDKTGTWPSPEDKEKLDDIEPDEAT